MVRGVPAGNPLSGKIIAGEQLAPSMLAIHQDAG
jgi:hypothetical protein